VTDFNDADHSQRAQGLTQNRPGHVETGGKLAFWKKAIASAQPPGQKLLAQERRHLIVSGSWVARFAKYLRLCGHSLIIPWYDL